MATPGSGNFTAAQWIAHLDQRLAEVERALAELERIVAIATQAKPAPQPQGPGKEPIRGR